METNKIKIASIITRLNIGGASIHVLLLSKHLRSRGYDTLLLAGECQESQGDLQQPLGPDDEFIPIPEMGRTISGDDLSALWRIYKLLRQEKPDIVHTHTAKAGFLGRAAAVLAGVPVVVHTFHGNSLRNYFSPLGSFVFRNIERVLAMFTDCICVVSEQQATEIGETFRVAPRNKIKVVSLGLNLERELAMEPPKPSGTLTVGWFGRLVPIKDVPLLVDVMKCVLSKTDKVRFLVAGNGPERAALEQAVRDMPGRLEWLGWQNDILPALSRCDLVIQTSRNEGTPVSLIQGMAAARPFVSTPAGGVVDMVARPMLRREGQTEWYANAALVPARPEAFAAAIAKFLADPQLLETMGASARQLASERYQYGNLVDTLDLLYRNLLSHTKRMPK